MLFDPVFQLSLISTGIALLISLVQKKTINHSELRRIKEEIKSLQNDMKEAQKKNNASKTNKILARTMELSKKQMMMVMKPALYTMPLFIIVFPLIANFFADVTYTFPMGLGIPWMSFSPFGFVLKTTLGWLGIYILVSIITSIALKKILKLSF